MERVQLDILQNMYSDLTAITHVQFCFQVSELVFRRKTSETNN